MCSALWLTTAARQSSDLILFTSEVALTAMHAAQATMKRVCTLLGSERSKRAAAASAMPSANYRHELRDAQDDRLASRLAALFTSLTSFVRASLLATAVRRAAEQANRADLRSSRAVSTAVGGVLRALQATEQLLVLLQRHYHDVVLPHLAHAINWHTKVSERRMRVLAVLILAHR